MDFWTKKDSYNLFLPKALHYIIKNDTINDISKERKMEFIERVDFLILDFIHENLSCKALDILMTIVSQLGNTGFIWIAAAAILFMIPKYNRCAATIVSGIAAGAFVGNLLLKNLIARQRPCWINDELELLIAVPQDFSFPSGHTLSAFAAAVVAMHFDKKIGAALYVFAVLTAFSRLYLYVHFPTDVIAGALIGAAVGIAVSKLSDSIAERYSMRNS